MPRSCFKGELWNHRHWLNINVKVAFLHSCRVVKHLYVQGTLQFNFPRAKSTQLFWKNLHWRLSDYAGKPQCLSFFSHSIFVLLLKLRTVNPFSFQPTWLRTVMDFCFFIRHLVLQLAHSNCYHTADGKFHLGFLLLTNGWFVDVFSPPATKYLFVWALDALHTVLIVQKKTNVSKFKHLTMNK